MLRHYLLRYIITSKWLIINDSHFRGFHSIDFKIRFNSHENEPDNYPGFDRVGVKISKICGFLSVHYYITYLIPWNFTGWSGYRDGNTGFLTDWASVRKNSIFNFSIFLFPDWLANGNDSNPNGSHIHWNTDIS